MRGRVARRCCRRGPRCGRLAHHGCVTHRLLGRPGWLVVSVLITRLKKWVSELGAVRHPDAVKTPFVGGDRDPGRLPDSSEELAVWADARRNWSAVKAKIQAH